MRQLGYVIYRLPELMKQIGYKKVQLYNIIINNRYAADTLSCSWFDHLSGGICNHHQDIDMHLTSS